MAPIDATYVPRCLAGECAGLPTRVSAQPLPLPLPLPPQIGKGADPSTKLMMTTRSRALTAPVGICLEVLGYQVRMLYLRHCLRPAMDHWTHGIPNTLATMRACDRTLAMLLVSDSGTGSRCCRRPFCLHWRHKRDLFMVLLLWCSLCWLFVCIVLHEMLGFFLRCFLSSQTYFVCVCVCGQFFTVFF